MDLHDGESGSQGISDPMERLGLAGASSRFLVVGETKADAEQRVPTNLSSKLDGRDALLRVRGRLGRLEGSA